MALEIQIQALSCICSYNLDTSIPLKSGNISQMISFEIFFKASVPAQVNNILISSKTGKAFQSKSHAPMISEAQPPWESESGNSSYTPTLRRFQTDTQKVSPITPTSAPSSVLHLPPACVEFSFIPSPFTTLSS